MNVHCIDCVPSLLVGGCSLLVDDVSDAVIVDADEDPMISSKVPGKQNPLVHFDTIPLSCSCSFYCIRTTMIQLLHVAVVEPLSSA